jgi:NitT/TauT family transport system substrate-binding protein
MRMMQSRRGFVASAAAASLLSSASTLADESPLETTTIRIAGHTNICPAPQYIADELLRAEGFTNIRYVARASTGAVASGEVDFDSRTAPWLVAHLDGGKPVVALAGVHSGCYELFAREPIRNVIDLKGKRVGIATLGGSGHHFLAIIVAHVGLDPHKDINWVAKGDGNFMDLLATGEVDAFLAFPPEPQELRARKIGRAIFNTTTDKPWSQYFCCFAYGNRDFVRNHPVATKRYLRAFLKAVDICASDPAGVAQRLVDAKYTPSYDYALQTLNELPYNRWREFDAEDSMRFYALRLYDVGMIKSNPKELITEGTDWRFLNELKRELKA